MTEVGYLTSMDEFNACHTEAGDKLVIIDFTATWCPPCQRIGPIFIAMAPEFPDVVFKKVDVDAAAPIAQHVGIACMPTFKVYKNGVEVGKLEGASEQGIKDLIN